MTYIVNTTKKITLADIQYILENDLKLQLSDEAKHHIVACREYLDTKMLSQKEPIYSINTGFGALCNVVIENDKLEVLQEKLVMSHACGMGDEVPEEIVHIMLLLKIQSLSYGKSAVQLETIERLIDFYNHKIHPVVYQQGSLGASGDLAPLAHLSLPLIGLGEVYYEGKKYNAKDVLQKLDLSPIKLKSKEGLALLNGTQFMSAYGVLNLIKSLKINKLIDFISCISVEAFDGRMDPFKEHIHTIRPHKGQIITSQYVREVLDGSEIIIRTKNHVQDPYSFRCIPQVHGATKDVTDYVLSVFETEINSVTDNPTVFYEEDEIISGGNFHGQPLAMALDFLSIAMAELGNISERRVYQLISGNRGLPLFLVSKSGLNSGLMIAQYTAASIVSQNKQLCTPASIDSIVSSNGQEDHVSMGANAATKCYQVIQNVEKLLAIELINASQAIEFRRPLKSSILIEQFLENYRKHVDFIEEDVIMYEVLAKTLQFVKSVKM